MASVLRFFIIGLLSFAGLGLSARAAEVKVVSFDPNQSLFEVPFSELPDRNYGQPFIVITGEIVPGDGDKLREAVSTLAKLDFPIVIKLESPGGDVAEALAMARFIRDLWATTWIDGRIVPLNDPDRSVITCDSACAILFFAGIDRRYSGSNLVYYRSGDPHYIPENRKVNSWLPAAAIAAATGVKVDVDEKIESVPPLGLHRPYFQSGYFGSLPPSEAQSEYAALEADVSAALMQFGVPDALIDKMMRTRSDDIVRIDSTELNEAMPTKEPWYEEWQIAKCGRLTTDEVTDLWNMKSSWEGAPKFSESYRSFLLNREAQIKECKTSLLLERQKSVLP